MGPQHPALPRTFPRHEEDQNFGGSGSERPDQHLNVLQPVRDNVAFSGSHQPEASLDLVPRHGSALGGLRTGSMCGLNVARSSAARLRCSRSSAPIAAARRVRKTGAWCTRASSMTSAGRLRAAETDMSVMARSTGEERDDVHRAAQRRGPPTALGPALSPCGNL